MQGRDDTAEAVDAVETVAAGRATPLVASEQRSVRVYAYGLLGSAVLAAAGLTVAGLPWPAPGPVFLLALAMAIAVNRFALFPTEHAATAEPAVLLAAVVAFPGTTVVLGALLVGLLVGPLDALHWQQRSFVRMAYNSGNRGLAALAAAGAYLATDELSGSRFVAMAVAVLAVAATDGLLSFVLLRLHGESMPDARRHVFDFDLLSVPIGAYGAGVGLLAAPVGWWATAVALVPIAFVPELLFTRWPWRRLLARVSVVLVAAAGVAVLACVASAPDASVVALLVGVALLAGVELVADERGRVPPLLAVVVVVAVVLAPAHAYFAAVFVALVATAVAWFGARGGFVARLGALLVATVGALAAAAVVELVRSSLPGTIAMATLAGFVFAGLVVVVGGRERGRAAARTVWGVPLVAVAAAWSAAGSAHGPAARVLGVVAVAATFVAVAWWGSPPWRSRILARWARAATGTRLELLLGVSAGAAMVLAVVAAGAAGAGARHAAICAAVAAGEGGVVMVLVGVRQWRFVARARVGWLVSLLVAATVLAIAYPFAAWDGDAWPVAIVVVVVAVVALAARVPVARTRELAQAR